MDRLFKKWSEYLVIPADGVPLHPNVGPKRPLAALPTPHFPDFTYERRSRIGADG